MPIVGEYTPKEALKATRKLSGDTRLEECNRLMGGHGMEAIRGEWQNGYCGDVVGCYVNMGDMYIQTVLWIREDNRARERFIAADLGWFVETQGKRYGIV